MSPKPLVNSHRAIFERPVALTETAYRTDVPLLDTGICSNELKTVKIRIIGKVYRVYQPMNKCNERAGPAIRQAERGSTMEALQFDRPTAQRFIDDWKTHTKTPDLDKIANSSRQAESRSSVGSLQFDRPTVRRFIDAWKNHSETPDLDKIASSATTLTEDGAEVPQSWQLNVRYCRFLFQLVKLARPKRVLEIGMANGISSSYIARARSTGTHEPNGSAHVIIDPFQTTDWHGAGRALLHRLNLDSDTDVIEDYSLHAVPELERRGERFDFVFIDGNHCLDYVLSDVLVCDRVLNVGGLMALDDSKGFGVRFAIPYLDRYRTNLQRIRLDGATTHWIRERFNKRRRVTIYRKQSEDERSAVGT